MNDEQGKRQGLVSSRCTSSCECRCSKRQNAKASASRHRRGSVLRSLLPRLRGTTVQGAGAITGLARSRRRAVLAHQQRCDWEVVGIEVPRLPRAIVFNSTASNSIFNHNPHQPRSNPLTTFTPQPTPNLVTRCY